VFRVPSAISFSRVTSSGISSHLCWALSSGDIAGAGCGNFRFALTRFWSPLPGIWSSKSALGVAVCVVFIVREQVMKCKIRNGMTFAHTVRTENGRVILIMKIKFLPSKLIVISLIFSSHQNYSGELTRSPGLRRMETALRPLTTAKRRGFWRKMVVIATAYCPCSECCGRFADNLTAIGRDADTKGVAVDRKLIPLGSLVSIPGYGTVVADDVGGAIKGKRIDVRFRTHKAALEWGRSKIVIYYRVP
jgi:3D (Asp-Asp-Asp) domain-containing protein